MIDLAPLQSRLPSLYCPDESVLCSEPGDYPSSGRTTWGSLGYLPYNVRYLILEALASFEDVENFMQATGAGSASVLGRNLRWKLFGVQLDIAQSRYAARIFHYSPGLVSYTIGWENIQRILRLMDRPFHGADTVLTRPSVRLTWPAWGVTHKSNTMSTTRRVSRVDFHFCCFGSVSYITGVAVDGSLVGYRGDRTDTEELPPTLTGLRLIFNNFGINAN